MGEALALAGDGDVWFIGGARIYAEAMAHVDVIDVTYVPDRVDAPDAVRAPPIDERDLRALALVLHEDEPALTRRTYRRRVLVGAGLERISGAPRAEASACGEGVRGRASMRLRQVSGSALPSSSRCGSAGARLGPHARAKADGGGGRRLAQCGAVDAALRRADAAVWVRGPEPAASSRRGVIAMLLPLQCTFRGMPHSDALEAHVTRRAAKLDRFFGRIRHCHVVIDLSHRHHRHGKRFRVSIDMTVTRRHEIAIARAPTQNQFLEDAHAAVDRAFDDAERRLDDWEQTAARLRQVAPGAAARPRHEDLRRPRLRLPRERGRRGDLFPQEQRPARSVRGALAGSARAVFRRARRRRPAGEHRRDRRVAKSGGARSERGPPKGIRDALSSSVGDLVIVATQEHIHA